MKRETKYDIGIILYFFTVLLGGAMGIAVCGEFHLLNRVGVLIVALFLCLFLVGSMNLIIAWSCRRLLQPVLTRAEKELQRRQAYADKYL